MTAETFPTFIGVDPTAGQQPFTYAVLDQDMHLVTLSAGPAEELMDLISSQPVVLLALNTPRGPNIGLVRKKMEAKNPIPGHLRGADVRMAEWELREHGIYLSPTPSRIDTCPAWMQMGFELYRLLEKSGFQQYPSRGASKQFFETHPHAAFCALLDRLPLPKPTLEGRLQRQTALFEQGMGMKDPMAFFEEITLHKILQGTLPMELVYSAEELDALMAAFVAFWVGNNPEESILVGDEHEGRIALPVKTLKDKYG